MSQNFYVAPTTQGTGDGLSPGNACQFSAVWAKPTLGVSPIDISAANGTYTGANSMINPPNSFSGAAGAIVTIHAANEGMAVIDGQQARVPIRVNGPSAYIDITGFNTCNSSLSGIMLSGSGTGTTNCNVRRCITWDNAGMGTSNNHGLAIEYGTNNLMEDCAVFGAARKGFYSFSNSGPNTYRRIWAQWNQSITQGPKQGLSFTYYAYQTLIENCIVSFNDQYMPDPYQVRNQTGAILTTYAPTGSGCEVGLPFGVVQSDGSCKITGQMVQNPYAAISHDNPIASSFVNCSILGTIAYGIDAPGTIPDRLWLISNIDNVTLNNVVAYYPNTAAFAGKLTFLLGNSPNAAGTTITNATSFKGQSNGNTINAQWTKTNVQDVTTPAALYTGTGPDGLNPESLFNTTKGAQVRYRYQDGVITATPLWPWPMNQRILDAMATTSYTPIDVNATMNGFFGSFPSEVPNGLWFTPISSSG